MMKARTLSDIEKVLIRASEITNHRSFVIAGSLSIIGSVMTPLESMCYSMDVDLYPKLDPGRAGEIAAIIGEGSQFALDNGVYADAISPAILSLPEQWESRLVQLPLPSGVIGWFLDPNDCAISKIIRGEERDIAWVRAGIVAGLLSRQIILSRIHSAQNVLAGEINQAIRLIDALN